MSRRHRITAYPDVNFTVVVNPGSGPGPEALPDGNYTREIPKLTAHPNTRVLGYVATTYTTRDKALVLKDVETYANWTAQSSNPKLAVNGIFFDETPQQFNASALEYLKDLTSSVKSLEGLGPDNFVSVFPPSFSSFLFFYVTLRYIFITVSSIVVVIFFSFSYGFSARLETQAPISKQVSLLAFS